MKLFNYVRIGYSIRASNCKMFKTASSIFKVKAYFVQLTIGQHNYLGFVIYNLYRNLNKIIIFVLELLNLNFKQYTKNKTIILPDLGYLLNEHLDQCTFMRKRC